ncbi:MAG TPA: undecaprenyl-diphosphate phosphatase [Candidatus Bathyarchaeota archaeon]|nr:undecaprenyl-diphosphate phosphatase [Candidatus Bathyarchaeota archaeon]
MVTLIEVFVLAVVQGLTEWLPISSSGHLVITQKILGLNLPLIYSVMLHFGTLIVVLTAFRKDIFGIIKAVVKRDFETDEGKLALFIVVGSVPIAFTGFVFHGFFESLFSNLPAVGLALLITGLVLFFAEKRLGNRKMGILDSILIGAAQAIAIIPGISRSGVTISTGLLRKVDKATAFKYSFLLSAPAIAGAAVMESKELVVGNIDLIPLLLGTIVSMIVGYASLKLLQKIVMNKKIHLFAYYCCAVGLAIIFFTLSQ